MTTEEKIAQTVKEIHEEIAKRDQEQLQAQQANS